MLRITAKILFSKFTRNYWLGHCHWNRLHHGSSGEKENLNLAYEKEGRDVCNMQAHGTKRMRKLRIMVQSRPFANPLSITHQ